MALSGTDEVHRRARIGGNWKFDGPRSRETASCREWLARFGAAPFVCAAPVSVKCVSAPIEGDVKLPEFPSGVAPRPAECVARDDTGN